MSDVIQESPEHVVYKLGKKPNDPTKPRLDLTRSLSISVQAPQQFMLDQALNASFIPYTWGNTQYGDCVIACRANHAQRLEFTERGFHVNIHEQDAIDEYKKLTGCVSPGDANDTGLVIQDALNEWRKNGWHVHYSHKPETIDAFGQIPATNMRPAIWQLGALHLGISLPLSAQAQTGNGYWDAIPDPGDGSTDPGSWGGHCVLCLGYDPNNFYVKTWGMVVRVTNAFMAKYCDEAWGVVDSVETKHPDFDQATLEADLKALGV